jgi:IS30 family transposase
MAQLTQFQRNQLEALIKSSYKHTQQEMADIIGCDQSTISRELRRARPPSGRQWYTATTAQYRAEQRRQQSYRQRLHWYDNPKVLRYIIEELRGDKSPDAISGRMKRVSPWHKEHAVSHESIYRYIWQVKEEGGCLHLHLPRKGKRPKFYGFKKASANQIPNRKDISKRPKIVEKNIQPGHWESDLIVSGRSGSGAVATFVERVSKYVQAVLLHDQTARVFNEAARGVFKELPALLRRTLTHDNGGEIAKHEQITEDLKLTVYCTQPYSAWQRGLNEHTNGLIRRFFPKGTDFSQVLPEELAKAIEKLNNLPRRSLRFLTPKEVFLSEIKDYAFQN